MILQTIKLKNVMRKNEKMETDKITICFIILAYICVVLLISMNANVINLL